MAFNIGDHIVYFRGVHSALIIVSAKVVIVKRAPIFQLLLQCYTWQRFYGHRLKSVRTQYSSCQPMGDCRFALFPHFQLRLAFYTIIKFVCTERFYYIIVTRIPHNLKWLYRRFILSSSCFEKIKPYLYRCF